MRTGMNDGADGTSVSFAGYQRSMN